jgi:hypothetical protein
MNTFFDISGNDAWNGAFQTMDGAEVWAGLVVIVPDPDRLYVTLGLCRTINVGIGIATEISACVGVARTINADLGIATELSIGVGVARTVRIEVER